ncbi:hypothetical protein KZ820_17475 [Sphingomonas sp. RRHST34]|uniref:Uncharacterized protein n=1 Tax=Sphingomonas citri TaxID=2862499 RepID=A0ABS7BSP1_9SPHN|nr:hypothetical protein [Sphingomonas citri]
MTSVDKARALFQVNAFGLIRMTQARRPVRRAKQGGRIVSVSSVLA